MSKKCDTYIDINESSVCATGDSQNLQPPAGQSAVEACTYYVHEGEIWRKSETGRLIYEPLCNFTAQIVEEIALDDGVQVERIFVLEGKTKYGRPLTPVRVPASQFPRMAWILDSWGNDAIVRAGPSKRDQLREAFQRLSPDLLRRRAFVHSGWRVLDGRWFYLMGDGAVGADGMETDLGRELSRYSLPRTPKNPKEAMKISLELLRVAPLEVTVPLWAAMYRAPLIPACPFNLGLWLEGPTGSLKSTLIALFLCHYGDFDYTSLPGSWSSTANQLEKRAFILKDTVFVIDDYAPLGSDAKVYEEKAARILRSQGNLSGRGRLNAELGEQPTYIPRGIVVSTGEQHPPGQSLMARAILMHLQRSMVDVAALSSAQRLAGRLKHGMAGYVQWLASQMEVLPAMLRKTFEGVRLRATRSDEHMRVPEGLAHLWLGLHSGLLFAEEIGACSPREAESLRGHCWEALVSLGKAQARVVEHERPTRRFLAVLHAMVTQTKAILLPKNNAPGNNQRVDQTMVGWIDRDSIYLIPDAAFQVVARFCRDTGEAFPVYQDRLLRDLKQEGLCACSKDRNTMQCRVGGRQQRVIRLRRSVVESLLEEKFPLGVSSVTSVTTQKE